MLAGERKHSREFGTARSRTGRIIQCSALPTPLMMSAGVADSANHLSNNYAFIAWEIFGTLIIPFIDFFSSKPLTYTF